MMTSSSVCDKCGITKKSGKITCCGRGGSWFDKCGGAGDTKVDHTWHEGLQACKARAQSSIVIGQQLKSVLQVTDNNINGSGDANSKPVITGGKPLSLTSAAMMGATQSVNTSTAYASSTPNSQAIIETVDVTISAPAFMMPNHSQ